MKKVVLQTAKLNKSFKDPIVVPVLKDITFSVQESEFVAVTGKSGCGK